MNHHRQSQEDPLRMSDLQAHYDKAGFHLLQLLIDMHTVSCSAEVFDRSCRNSWGTLTGSYRIDARIDLRRSWSLAAAQSSICCTSSPTAHAFPKGVHFDSHTLRLCSISIDLQIAQATCKIQFWACHDMMIMLLKPFLSMLSMAGLIFHRLAVGDVPQWCTSRAALRCMCLALDESLNERTYMSYAI